MEKNYLKEYYKKTAEEKDLLNIYKEDLDLKSVNALKKEVKKISNELALKTEALKKEYEKAYSENFIRSKASIILWYSGRNASYYYELETGLPVFDVPEGSVLVGLSGTSGTVKIAVGYRLDYPSIVVHTYSYRIRTDKSRINVNYERQSIVSFLTNQIVTKFASEGAEAVSSEYDWDLNRALDQIDSNEFINELYGLNLSNLPALSKMRSDCQSNKSFEIILRTAPENMVSTLLEIKTDEAVPIHKMLGVSKQVYEKVLEKGYLSELVQIRSHLIQYKDILKMNDEDLLDFLKNCHFYDEQFRFYDIKKKNYGYGNLYISEYVIESYARSDVFKENYTFRHFVAYVLDGTVQQGFSSLENFLNTLRDYLSICKMDGAEPTLQSSYLTQTHDIASRNHRVIVSAEEDQKFQAQYKTFKTYTYKGYSVLAPKKADDLKVEGSVLNHCVGSYIKSVIDGACQIFFLRKEKDKPLVTLEVRDGKIAQVHGAHNRKPTTEEIDILRHFAKAKELRYDA